MRGGAARARHCGIKVLARANVALSGAGILLSLQVRAEDPDVAAIVVASVG